MAEELEEILQDGMNAPQTEGGLSPEKVKTWRNRAQVCNRIHRKALEKFYKNAKKRYNSENYGVKKVRETYTHESFNFLFRDVENFNASIYYKNPEIDYIPRATNKPDEVRNIENLQQIVNDEVKDNRSLKALIRSLLVDENLAALGAAYIDYDYKSSDVAETVEGTDTPKQNQESNKVEVCKILPENLIYPKNQTLYNYQDSPFLGYVDIVSMEKLKADTTLDKEQVKLLKGRTYADLIDSEFDDNQEQDTEKLDDDMKFEKVFYLFIKGEAGPVKRLVISEDANIQKPLFYGDFDRGHGPDGRGYPIHILALNDACQGFIPPSEAKILEGVLNILDYLLHKFMRHLKMSKTKTLVKGGPDGVKKENFSKMIQSDDLEFIIMSNLPPAADVRSLIYQMQDQGLSLDHMSMFELAKRVFDELCRKPAFSQVAVQDKKKTATEVQAIQTQDLSVGAYKVDKFKDFLCGLFYDWGKLIQKNRIGNFQISVKNKDTGEDEERDVTMGEEVNETDGEFNADINIKSFVAPNKEVKRKIVGDTIAQIGTILPLMSGKKRINGDRALMDLLENAEVRNPDEYLIDVPIRPIDQQVMELAVKGVPINVEEMGGNAKDNLRRGMEIFSDHELIGRLENLSPGIGEESGPIANMLRDLEALASQNDGTQPQPKPESMSDMRMQASQMAEAQT